MGSDPIAPQANGEVRRESSLGGHSFHVLHVTQSTYGGVAAYVRGVIEDQVDRGWRVTLVSPMGSLQEQVRRVRGVSVLVWEARRDPGPSLVREVRSLRLLMRATRPDLIHLHSSKAGLVGRLAAMGQGVPTLFQPHGWSFEAVTGSLRSMSMSWERLGARMCQRIICVSEAEGERGRRAGVRAGMEVVPSGVSMDVAPAVPSPGHRSAVRAELGLPPGPLVVCVGRMCEQKGQDLLLAAWSRIIERVPSAHLVLIGEGTLDARLRMRAGPSVLLAGPQEDVFPWLSAADLVVAPSRWEGLSLAVLEAMAAGRSVVATDVDGMRESIGESSGCVVPPEDPDALVPPIVARLTDPELATVEGSSAARRARELFDVRRTHETIARLYQEVCRAAAIGEARSSRQAVPV